MFNRSRSRSREEVHSRARALVLLHLDRCLAPSWALDGTMLGRVMTSPSP
jgi:hypothetical protein